MTIKVFTPQDARENFVTSIPDFVFQAFNQLLSEKWYSKSITITQNQAIDRIQSLCPDADYLERETIFDNHWLDVEDIYRRNGWNVEYDKPGYNESYDAKFIFKPK